MFVLFVGDFALKMSSKHSAEAMSSVPKHKKTGIALWRKYICWISFVQAWVLLLVAMNSMLIN